MISLWFLATKVYMSKDTTPKYVLVIDNKEHQSMEWKRSYGKPTTANLEKFIIVYAKSLETNGCNAHISKGLGFIPYPSKAKIKFNKTNGATVVEWKAPMFMMW